MSKRAILNKVIGMLDKQAAKQSLGLSFTIILDDTPPEVYQTRGYKHNDPDNKSNPTQKVQTNES